MLAKRPPSARGRAPCRFASALGDFLHRAPRARLVAAAVAVVGATVALDRRRHAMPSESGLLPNHRLPLPREHISRLTYERFLRMYALPRVPCVIEGVGADWPALGLWRRDYFLEHEGVDLDHACSVSVGEEEREMTVGDALRSMNGAGPPVYLSGWDYVRGNSRALAADFDVPGLFERTPTWLARHAIFGNAEHDMRWLYIGEACTGSPTHVDTNLSSAWLWVACGEKVRRTTFSANSPAPRDQKWMCVPRGQEWVCAHGDDHDLVVGDSSGGTSDVQADSGYAAAALPDLFAPDVGRHPRLGEARLYRGTQRAGEVVFNPSRCVHAVRSPAISLLICPRSPRPCVSTWQARNVTFTASLTHNFVDVTNLADAVADATRSERAA